MKTILPILRKTISINTLIVVLCLVIYSIGVNATVRYVKPIATGMGDGSSWGNASGDIQTMINASSQGDSVWVAAGEYKPNSYPPNCPDCTNSRFYTFYVKDGVRLFGNFNGFEMDINQRDFSGNATILNGDFNNNDVMNDSTMYKFITGNDENVYHVILVSDISAGNLPVTIDGFNISGGNANEYSNYIVSGISISTQQGGGICIQNQKINITNCFIYFNSASHGGGIFSNAQNTVVNNNIIANNIAIYRGGGFANYFNLSTISNNSFIGNFANRGGGGIYCILSETFILNNEFNGNTAGLGGGGLLLWYGTNSVSYNTITNNYSAYSGGGISSLSGTNIFSNNIMAYNIGGINGGCLYIPSGLNLIINNVFYSNRAEMYGGGLFFANSTNTISNNTLVNNTAMEEGGGVYVHNGINGFINNILWDNKQNTEIGVLSADLFLNGGSNTFQNNILQLDSMLYTGIFFSLGVTVQGNLFAQNPNFVSNDNPTGEDLVYFTQDDGLRLTISSPALNAGTTTNAPTTDILNFIRDTQPDIGAYEHGVFVGIQPNIGSTPTTTLNAYPNPATDAITFTFTTPITDNSTLLLYAIDGQNITSLYKGTTQAGQTNSLTIDTKAFTPSTYCAVLRCGNGLAHIEPLS